MPRLTDTIRPVGEWLFMAKTRVVDMKRTYIVNYTDMMSLHPVGTAAAVRM